MNMTGILAPPQITRFSAVLGKIGGWRRPSRRQPPIKKLTVCHSESSEEYRTPNFSVIRFCRTIIIFKLLNSAL